MYVYNSLVIFIPNSSPKLLPDPPHPVLLPSKVHSFKNVILKPLCNDFSIKNALYISQQGTGKIAQWVRALAYSLAPAFDP